VTEDDPTATLRVLVYSHGAGADLALPGDVPVAVLLPELHDLLTGLGLRPRGAVALAPPGQGPLDGSKTLHQSGVRDGAVLTLVTAGVRLRAPALIDPAVAVAAVAGRPGAASRLAVRRAGAVVATVMAALTGFLVVPGGPGSPDVLLASGAVAVTAALSVRIVGDPAGVGSATVWLAALCSVPALAGTLGRLSAVTSGLALTVVSLAVLASGARLVVRVSSGTADPDLLHGRLAALAAGSAAGATVGVVAVAGAQPGWAPCVLGAVVSGVLVLRIRAHRRVLGAAALGGGAIICAAAALLRLQVQLPLVSCLLGAALGVAGLLLAVSSGRIPVSPATHRALSGLELGLLAAVTPVGCWTVGAFGLP
jgi:hypothetical protein